MMYATKSPFKIVEHASFIYMVNVMRPGYKLPSRREIGGSLLDKVYDKECEKSVVDLEGKTKTQAQSIFWTQLTHPVTHTHRITLGIAKSSIETAEHKYKCKVCSFVTDNAANVVKMKSELLKDDEYNLISYGCSAHILNLLAKDLEIGNI
ncbi:uncharacterized protein LOC126992417 [Eriocheir sinensis]|uniref:uncharacterized protein LOC126992417 n=1 Tax=Eriocheir sinensis TaxID=95602 RepID=UPI0021C937A2|nr:uncharacterized protein LOC126992417 [Eriocheir sinensis]